MSQNNADSIINEIKSEVRCEMIAKFIIQRKRQIIAILIVIFICCCSLFAFNLYRAKQGRDYSRVFSAAIKDLSQNNISSALEKLDKLTATTSMTNLSPAASLIKAHLLAGKGEFGEASNAYAKIADNTHYDEFYRSMAQIFAVNNLRKSKEYLSGDKNVATKLDSLLQKKVVAKILEPLLLEQQAFLSLERGNYDLATEKFAHITTSGEKNSAIAKAADDMLYLLSYDPS